MSGVQDKFLTHLALVVLVVVAVVAVEVVDPVVVVEPFVRMFEEPLLKLYMLLLVFEWPPVILWHNL